MSFFALFSKVVVMLLINVASIVLVGVPIFAK